MSINTTLHLYRPTPPPVINGASLAEFIRSFRGLKLSEDEGPLTVQVKFGSAIDQDESPTSWQEPPNSIVSITRDIEWDVAEQCQSLVSLEQLLASHGGCIYRACLGLGDAADDVIDSLKRVNSPDNDMDLCLTGWSLSIEPILSASFSSETYFVGWISVSLSGYGYLYPWTFSELVQRAEAHPRVRQLTELCRTTWPVEPRPPTPKQLDVRRQMGELWPYERIDLPWDWYWGLKEG